MLNVDDKFQVNVDLRKGESLRASEVKIAYGRKTIISNFSADIKPGITALIGPNGAGKSTLLQVLSTARPPTAGNINVCGLEIEGPGALRQVRRNIGYLPQDPAPYPSFRVGEYLNYIAILKEVYRRGDRRQEILRVLKLVDLEDRIRERVRRLSGGTKQRLALAAALLADPKILILDEPTVGLDPSQRIRLRELLASLGSTKIVLLSTHLTDDVSLLCKNVLVLRGGQVILNGSTRDLIERARGKVWLSEEYSPGALSAYATSSGEIRNVGTAPADALMAEPTLDDGYLVTISDWRPEVIS